jgi:hypothetical protein
MKAFPTTNWKSTPPLGTGYDEGMDLRDYFAAKAMQRLVDLVTHPKDVARNAYIIADAMMKERTNETN